jgi:hypothetical protein
MPSIAISVTRQAEGVESQERFCVLDGFLRIVIEAASEQDARYLCQEMGWEFICQCDD